MGSPNTFKKGWRDNTGPVVIHTWEVWLSIANDAEECGYHLELIQVEAPGHCRLDTIAKKALLAAELQTWDFTHQEIQITRGPALPSGWVGAERRKHNEN